MFDVYIANLGKYNEGELMGGWISLPVTKEEWESFLVRIKLGRYEDDEFHHGYEEDGIIYEEWAIHDHNTDYNLSIGEFDNIQLINYLAAALENSANPELAFEYYNYSCCDDDYESLINVLLQEEMISFYYYDFPGILNCTTMSNEEKLGYTMAYTNGVLDLLESHNLDSYFDFESYSQAYIMDGNLALLDDGYIDMNEYINLSYYTYEEIEDEFEDYNIY